MMLQVMAYSIAVAAALSVVGACGERLARLQGLPQRGAWMVAMLLSVMVPAAMILLARPATADAVPAPVALLSAPVMPLPPADAGQADVGFVPAPEVARQISGAPSSMAWRIPAPTDRQLVLAWALASAGVMLYLCGAGLALRRRAACWQTSRLLEQDVLVSEVTGPALLGVLRPRMVVPRWLQSQPPASQALILEHERQHMQARDPLLILAGWLIVAAVPWNLPLWWQWHRMRQAIELDCDARVMRSGAEAGIYAAVLLQVTRRAGSVPAGALAMSEPVHALERRIAGLMPDAVRWPRLQAFAVLMLALLVVGAVSALEAPALPDRGSGSALAVSGGNTASRMPDQAPDASIAAAAVVPPTVLAAAAPRPPVVEPASTAPAPAPSASAVMATSFKVRLLQPVAEPAVPSFFAVSPAPPRPAGAPDAAARARLERYFSILAEELRGVPGLELVTEPGVPDVPYEIVMRVGADWQGVSIEATSARNPNGYKVLWRSFDTREFFLATPRLTALWDEIPVDDPDRDMANYVQRLRLEMFPLDRAFLSSRMSELRDPGLETDRRRHALYQLMRADARPDSLPGRFPPQTYRPDRALLNAATDVAMTASDPVLRLSIWNMLAGISIPRIDPAVLVEPAARALEKEADLRVQLALVSILSVSLAEPQARATLESVARGNPGNARPELVRLAAQRVLHGGEGWSEYFVSRLDDPQVADAERLELINYVYSVSGANGVRLGDAVLQLDEAAERSLSRRMKSRGSTAVAVAAVDLLRHAGGAVAREEFIGFLRAGTGQPLADNAVRRAVLSALAFSLRLHPEDRSLFEEVMARDLDPAMREAARQALDQTM